MDTLELANDYVNESFGEFTDKWKDKLDEGVYNYLDSNKEYREEWRGVPISRMEGTSARRPYRRGSLTVL